MAIEENRGVRDVQVESEPCNADDDSGIEYVIEPIDGGLRVGFIERVRIESGIGGQIVMHETSRPVFPWSVQRIGRRVKVCEEVEACEGVDLLL